MLENLTKANWSQIADRQARNQREAIGQFPPEIFKNVFVWYSKSLHHFAPP